MGSHHGGRGGFARRACGGGRARLALLSAVGWCLVAGLAGCLPVSVFRGSTTRADVRVVQGPPVSPLNLLRLQVGCAGTSASDACSSIATVAIGATTTARVIGVFDASTTVFVVPGFTVGTPVYTTKDGNDVVTFQLGVPSTVAPGLYSVYAQNAQGLSVLSGALEVVE
jgi:hypothetical protein